MTKLQYEKNNSIKLLKNEIYGVNQLIDILEKLEEFEYSKLDNKIINIKLERALREFTNEYITVSRGYYDYEMKILIKDRYNKDTKSYIGYHDSFTVNIATVKTLSDAGKEQIRFDYFNTVINIKNSIDELVKRLIQYEDELSNIDSIVNEIKKLDDLVLNFKEGKSSTLLESFKSIRNYY